MKIWRSPNEGEGVSFLRAEIHQLITTTSDIPLLQGCFPLGGTIVQNVIVFQERLKVIFS